MKHWKILYELRQHQTVLSKMFATVGSTVSWTTTVLRVFGPRSDHTHAALCCRAAAEVCSWVWRSPLQRCTTRAPQYTWYCGTCTAVRKQSLCEKIL